jgi:hypothetical protein
MDFHAWEYARAPSEEIIPYRHRRRVGEEMQFLFQNLLNHLATRGYRLVSISEIVRLETGHTQGF